MVKSNSVAQKARVKTDFRPGHGYSISELKAVGLTVNTAKKLHISIDLRRKTSYDKNIEYLLGQYNLTKKEIKAVQKPKLVKQKKTAPAPKKETKPTARKVESKPEPKAVEKAVVLKAKPEAKVSDNVESKPAEREIAKTLAKPAAEVAAKAKAEPVKVTPKVEPAEKKKTIKETTRAKKTTDSPKKTTTAKITTEIPKSTTKATSSEAKTLSTEELHKMYNEETGKNAIWRGREAAIYLKWLEKKKKDLGL